MEELSLDNILTDSEIENLFVDNDIQQESAPDNADKDKGNKP